MPIPPHGTVERGPPWSYAQVFASDEDIKHCKAEIIHNASPSVLIEAALRREQGTFLTSTGALSVRSGAKTGRSPKDKRVVVEPQSENNVWWGPVRAQPCVRAFSASATQLTRFLQAPPN